MIKIIDSLYLTEKKDAIAPIFQSDGTNIIETFGNLDNAQNMKASLFLQWYPFSEKVFTNSCYSIVYKL